MRLCFFTAYAAEYASDGFLDIESLGLFVKRFPNLLLSDFERIKSISRR